MAELGVGIMKPVFQDMPVEDGVRLLTPHGKRRDSVVNAFCCATRCGE
jgi:hypothetical protein